MARKKDKEQRNLPAPEQKGEIFLTPLEEVLPGSMLPYAEYVILDRAPAARGGRPQARPSGASSIPCTIYGPHPR